MSQPSSKIEIPEIRDKKALDRTVPAYARLFFDHLYSEYTALKPSISDYSKINILEEIQQKREQRQLTWSDIYTFDLTLVDVRPPESLIRKAFDSRARYRSVAGQKEFDEYLASKPMDLGAVQIDPDANPPKPNVLIERELRADIKYLLSKFYLYYALLPMREGLRDDLTRRAVIVTAVVVVLIGFAIGFNVGGSFWIPGLENLAEYLPVVITVLTVTLAGIIGGCVSMLQRIQSAPSEGDALFNLAALTNGWRGILLAPLYGGIFACLLFVMFAGGILNGAVFPTIVTPAKSQTFSAAPAAPANVPKAATPTPTPASTVVAAESPNAQATNLPSATVTPVTRAEAQKPEPSSPSVGPRAGVLQIKDFLRETGPASGISYALLIIWSFLAGFAERLVPDTLNRLVQKNADIQGGKG